MADAVVEATATIGGKVTPFAQPPEPGPPHTQYCLSWDPPYKILALPDGLPAPHGYRWITVEAAAFFRASVAAGGGFSAPSLTSGETAPSYAGPPKGAISRMARVRTAREPRAPRIPRDPRSPRPSRSSRPARPYREPRPDRWPRGKRKRRDPRPPRPSRPPRKTATKDEEFDCWCGYNLATGQNAQFGSPGRFPKGFIPSDMAPGTGGRRAECGIQCGGSMCEGPLAPVLLGLFDLLPDFWRARPEDADGKILGRKLDERRAARKALPPARKRIWSDPKPHVNTGYCCLCGATGGCYSSGGDCRKAAVLQRSKGEC